MTPRHLRRREPHQRWLGWRAGGRRSIVFAWVVVALLMAAALSGQETRTIRRIDRPAARAPLYEGPAGPLPTRESCEAAVRGIAEDYGPGGLERWLGPDFPNREEVLDLLERVALYATRIELTVESIESVKIEPWRVAEEAGKTPDGGALIFSECVADVRTRISFDDPATGRKTVRDVGRAQWRLRYDHEVEP